MPELTVALPLYNAKKIAWLALESLCRQQVSGFEWELIVCEESAPRPFTHSRITPFFQRLKDAGCVSVQYATIDLWIPLAQKWRMIGAMTSPDSIAFVLQAGDCYSQPNRLATTFRLISEGADWVQSPKGVFSDIKRKKDILYNADLTTYPTALNMAFRTEYACKLEASSVRKGVDRWLLNQCTRIKGSDLKVGVDDSDDWRNGVDTHGYNNLSRRRGKFFDFVTTPFEKTNLTLRDCVPEDVYEKLRLL